MIDTSTYLRRHVVDHVWCAPDQDINLIIAPKRISTYTGALASENILWETINLPDKTNWYHIYQIGNMSPSHLGLPEEHSMWVRASTHCNNNNLLITTYTDKGLEFHADHVWFLRMLDGNIIVAVRDNDLIDKLPESTLYMRFYKNTYFSKPLCPNKRQGIVVYAGVVNTVRDLNAIVAANLPYRSLPGKCFYTVNGRRVQDLTTNTVDFGNYVQWVWDSSVKEVVETPLKDLPKFVSARDRMDKYLLYRGGDLGDTIDYYDDNDIIVVRKTDRVRQEGLYYNRNNANSVRMVTHKDYSIPVGYVGYLTTQQQWHDTGELYVQIIVRHSGRRPDLVSEHHRLVDLFKLSPEDRLQAMVATDAVVDVWKAASLEDSAYVKLMGIKNPYRLDQNMVYDAYGYNTMAMLLVGELRKYSESDDWIDLEPGLHEVCTGFEFDADGKLLRYDTQTNAVQYPRRDKTAKYVELYPGLGQLTQDITIDEPMQVLNPKLNYGFYVCETWGGEAVTPWRTAIEGEEYTIEDGVVMWDVADKYMTAVKSDLHFLVESRAVTANDYVFSFDVSMSTALNDGERIVNVPPIPFGQLDIWMNQHHLVNGIDYIVNWPNITITNKKYQNQTPTQHLVIRGTGLCSDDMALEEPCDKGYVVHGKLSYNGRYDIRDDKPIRIVVDGRVYTRDEVHWSEEHQCFCVENIPNGAPYQVFDSIVPLRLQEPIHDQFVYRAASRLVDRQISDYLTLHIPEEPEVHPNPILGLHAIYSPMMAKILYDVKMGVIPPATINKTLSDNEVYQLTEPYKYMESKDPVFVPGNVDLDYVNIHTHPFVNALVLSVWEWRFIRAVNRTRFAGRLQMSKTLQIEPGYEYEYETD